MGIPLTEARLQGKPPEESDEVRRLTAAADAERRKKASLGQVKRIIGVHSGKGGVGKTFIAVNLAFALAARGKTVGLLDGDVDCPNVPRFLGIKKSLYFTQEKRFKPVVHQGVKIVSMGFTKDDESDPIFVRGPAKHRVIIDFLTNTDWGELDILIIDFPPGTSDVPMSLLEFGGLQGILYVTTPQKESLIDTRKSIRMGKTFGIPALGIVENMSGKVFGEGKVQALAKEYGITFFESIPLNENIFSLNEQGAIAFLDPVLKEIVASLLDVVEKQ